VILKNHEVKNTRNILLGKVGSKGNGRK